MSPFSKVLYANVELFIAQCTISDTQPFQLVSNSTQMFLQFIELRALKFEQSSSEMDAIFLSIRTYCILCVKLDGLAQANLRLECYLSTQKIRKSVRKTHRRIQEEDFMLFNFCIYYLLGRNGQLPHILMIHQNRYSNLNSKISIVIWSIF